MNPLTAIYDAGISLRNRMYDGGRLRSFRLQSPVVSIGSISAGGAGKTPPVTNPICAPVPMLIQAGRWRRT